MQIVLNNGDIVLIGPKDKALKRFMWRSDGRGYPVRSATVAEIKSGLPKNIYLHREIMGFPEGEVDHINQDKLDNRRSNLRLATRRQNAINQKKRVGPHHSVFKGVTWHKQNRMWMARIRCDGESWCKCFHSEAEAARAYNFKAKELLGPFAYLNPV